MNGFKHNYLKIIQVLIFICGPLLLQGQSGGNPDRKIVIEIEGLPATEKDSIELSYIETDYLQIAERKTATEALKGRDVKWTLYSDKPILISATGLKILGGNIAEPGDSVHIIFLANEITYFGRGSAKFRLRHKIDALRKQFLGGNRHDKFVATSLLDFLDWNSQVKRQLDTALAFVDTHRRELSAYAYNYLRVNVIMRAEEDRLDKFWSLQDKARRLGLTGKDLSAIFDSCFFREPANWARSMSAFHPGWYAFIRAQVYRNFNFNSASDSLSTAAKRRFLYYEQGKQTYQGHARERFLFDLIANETIREIGFTPETELLLEKYYREPGFSEYKTFLRSVEASRRTLRKGQQSPKFSLTDINGKIWTKEMVAGKIVIMDFWFTGCKGCVETAPILKNVKKELQNNPNVLFLSISTDKSRTGWLKSVIQEKYTSNDVINLYTEGKGNLHPMLKAYGISAFPTIFLIDGLGQIVQNPVPDLRGDNGAGLLESIRKQLTLMHNGPFIVYNNGTIHATSVSPSSNETLQYALKKDLKLRVATDEFNTFFELKLKDVIEPEPTLYPAPEKMLVLSDIEGNFSALRKLLQAANVIDDQLNWTFGKGHLVLNGDMVDRGDQVVECLWFIYSLEEKAKKQGGYVHFLLGNHEIMNLNGDMRYVVEKYKANPARLMLYQEGVWGKNSELGRWLRSKNIIEKIGNILFVHAGMSMAMNQTSLSVSQINELARLYYDSENTALKADNRDLRAIFDPKHSPFWYRLYYQDATKKMYVTDSGVDTTFKTSDSQVEETLHKFEIARIITGHTIISDTISVHYDGKVINTDTRHASGFSEGLLIDGSKYYRVNTTASKPAFIPIPLIETPTRQKRPAGNTR